MSRGGVPRGLFIEFAIGSVNLLWRVSGSVSLSQTWATPWLMGLADSP